MRQMVGNRDFDRCCVIGVDLCCGEGAISGWEDAAETAANVAWARDLWQRTRPFSTGGVYVNYLGVEGEVRPREFLPSQSKYSA